MKGRISCPMASLDPLYVPLFLNEIYLVFLGGSRAAAPIGDNVMYNGEREKGRQIYRQTE